MKKLSKTNWFWIILIAPIYNPTALQYIPGLTAMYQYIQIWKLLALIFIVLIYILQRKASAFVLGVILMEAVSVGISAINNVYDTKVYTNALLAIGLCMMTELAIRFDFYKFINNLFKVLFFIVCVNFILCLLYPKGLSMATLYKGNLNPLYLIAIDNGIIKELVPLIVSVLYIYYWNRNDSKLKGKGNRLDNIYKFLIGTVFAISSLTLLIVGSATGIMTFLVFVFLLALYNNVMKNIIPYKFIILIYALFMIIVVVLGTRLSFINDLNKFLGRSVTFTGRIVLWKMALEMIAARPILGYGYTSGNIEVWYTTMSSHNMFLELIIQGGLIYFALFVTITVVAIRRNRNEEFRLSNLIFAGIFSYLLVGLMEVGISPSYYILLTMAWFPVYKHNGLRNRYIRY